MGTHSNQHLALVKTDRQTGIFTTSLTNNKQATIEGTTWM